MTSIEWTNETWNPVRGCAIVSAGCTNCYAMKYAHRFASKGFPYEGLTKMSPGGPVWTGAIKLVPGVLGKPLSWKTARRIFVNSMSDLFHEKIPDSFLDDVFATMAVTRRHTFQVLTKRPERMRAYLASRSRSVSFWEAAARRIGYTLKFEDIPLCPFPLPNVWLGVSVEDQRSANERIPLLLQTPAAVRWISAEPLLAPIDLRSWLSHEKEGALSMVSVPALDWVVIGGESGPNARLFDVEWARRILAQCKVSGIPAFMKQLGSKPTSDIRTRPPGEPSYWTSVLKSRKGGDPDEWPEDLRVREYPR